MVKPVIICRSLSLVSIALVKEYSPKPMPLAMLLVKKFIQSLFFQNIFERKEVIYFNFRRHSFMLYINIDHMFCLNEVDYKFHYYSFDKFPQQ